MPKQAQRQGVIPVAEPGAGVAGMWDAPVLAPGALAAPGGQWVVPLGGCEMGGLFIGSFGVVGVELGVFGLVGVLGAAMALKAAALSTRAERVADNNLMIFSFDWVVPR